MKRVILLGAGASYGHGVCNVPRPPLSSAFFIGGVASALQEPYADFTAYLERVMGIDRAALEATDIEDLATRIDLAWPMGLVDAEDAVREFGVWVLGGGPPGWLRSYIVDSLLLSTKWLTRTACPLHLELFRKSLHRGDTVVSFNYDLIADAALKRLGDWNEKTGYFGTHRGVVDDDEVCGLSLLKPHGSLNWYHARAFPSIDANRAPRGSEVPAPEIEALVLERALNGETPSIGKAEAGLSWAPRFAQVLGQSADALEYFSLTTRGGQDFAMSQPIMILPTEHKRADELTFGQLANVWRRVRQNLREATELIAIGFSFRDHHFNQVLFEALAARTTQLRITIVDPHPEDAESRLSFARNVDILMFRGTLIEFIKAT